MPVGAGQAAITLLSDEARNRGIPFRDIDWISDKTVFAVTQAYKTVDDVYLAKVDKRRNEHGDDAHDRHVARCLGKRCVVLVVKPETRQVWYRWLLLPNKDGTFSEPKMAWKSSTVDEFMANVWGE